ncbi:mavicyanin-like [Cucurbita pepo subsp. pepo]|uniref:mavicyanin-like n=1 Tax=Cucurbita pepo subsp. pepo TaxID=3664 RepID=UPI000C9D7C6A|nr:mavicyanin-like [Cucurbita pepo subsp. pepo]
MASLLSSAFFLLFLFFHFFSATCSEFLVGDEHGWAVPQHKHADRYNKWASHNRFNVDDALHFKFEKDSVMEVTEEEYKQCLSSKPLLYNNNGDAVVRLERAGLFYFISGVSGHCEKGQRMIIKVLEPLSPPQPPTAPPQNNTTPLSVSSPMLALFFTFFVSFLFI